MDQLLAIKVFVRIAEAGSFARAADTLDLPRSSVSKLLQDLEQHLGVKLVERSTRALTITPEGEAYRDQAVGLLADLEAMDAAAGEARVRPRSRKSAAMRPARWRIRHARPISIACSTRSAPRRRCRCSAGGPRELFADGGQAQV